MRQIFKFITVFTRYTPKISLLQYGYACKDLPANTTQCYYYQNKGVDVQIDFLHIIERQYK